MRLFPTIFSLLLLCGCQTVMYHGYKDVHAKLRHKELYLVMDDAGLDLYEVQQFLDIPVPMTIAVLPHLDETREVCAAIGRHPSKEIILHQPMEAYNRQKNPGSGAIDSSTHPDDVARILRQNLKSVKGAVGMNNHMGSRITEDPQLMREVLRYCKANDLFFLDSKTAYNSRVPHVASKEHMHMEQRHVFLDIRRDRESVRNMWGRAVAHARTNGYAIVIGHVWNKETAAAIRDSYQTLENQGYTFRKLSELYE